MQLHLLLCKSTGSDKSLHLKSPSRSMPEIGLVTVSLVGRLKSPSKLPETLGKPFSWPCSRGASCVSASSIKTAVCCSSDSMTSAAEIPLPLLFTARKTSSRVVSARPYPLTPSSCFEASRSSRSLEKLRQTASQSQLNQLA